MFLTSFSKNYDAVSNFCHSFVPLKCVVNFSLKDVLTCDILSPKGVGLNLYLPEGELNVVR